MRIAVVTESMSRSAGGLFESVRRLSQEMQQAGQEISVFATADAHTANDIAAWLPLVPQCPPLRGATFFGYAPGLRTAIRESGSEIINVHGIWKYSAIAASEEARAADLKLIVHPHGMLDPWALRNSAWKKRIANLLYGNALMKRASCIRALNDSEARSVRLANINAPICTIPNGIDLPANTDTVASSTSEILPGRKVLLSLGRIHPKKGLDVLLHAWAQICKNSQHVVESDNWVLVIAGWDQGNHEEQLRHIAMVHGLDGRVVFAGPQFGEQKAAWYRRCDAFVLPSLSEGLPMVILESWAYSKPVVMTPECNLPEGIAAGAALLVSAQKDSVAAGLNELLRMTDHERAAMGARGFELVRQKYSWKRTAAELVEVHSWLLGGGQRPQSVSM